MLRGCSLPFFTPSRVVQALIDILEPLCSRYGGAQEVLQTTLAMYAAFGSERAYGERWSARRTVIVPQLSLAALNGEGWAFGMKMHGYYGTGGDAGYAFFRVVVPPPTPAQEDVDVDKKQGGDEDGKVTNKTSAPAAVAPAPSYEIYDLPGFLEKMAEEGRPAPPEEAVKKLQDVLAQLGTEHGLKLMGSGSEPGENEGNEKEDGEKAKEKQQEKEMKDFVRCAVMRSRTLY